MCDEFDRITEEKARAVIYLEGVRRAGTYKTLELAANSQVLSFDLVLKNHVRYCADCISEGRS
jgi:hypothetical protein